MRASLLSALTALSSLAFPSFFAVVEQESEFLSQKEASRTGFVKVGGSIEGFNERGLNPLHCAIEGQCSWALISSFLRDYRAQVNAQTQNEGFTPLMLALKVRQEALVLNLLEIAEIDVNLVSRDGRSALHFACQTGSVEVVRILLQRGASPDLCMHGTKMKPIHFAIQHRHLDILKLFQEFRIPLNGLYLHQQSSAMFESCLHMLARAVNEASFSAAAKIEMATLLLPYFNEAEQSLVTESVLKVASEEGNDALIAVLLVFGADWTEPGLAENHLISAFESKFPGRASMEPSLLPELWDLAIELGSFDLILALRAAKVPTEQIGEAALIMAMTLTGNDELCALLIRTLSGRTGINVQSLMCTAVAVSLPSTLRAIIETFRPQSFALNYGQNLLHLAATNQAAEARSCTEIVRILLQAASYLIHEPDVTGNTPLHIASASGSIGFLQGLFGVQFIVDQPDGNGNTALYLAYKAGHFNACFTLLQLGSQESLAVNSQDAQDRFNLESLQVLFRELPANYDDDEESKSEFESERIDLLMKEFALDHEEIVFTRRPVSFEVESGEETKAPLSLYEQAISFLLETSRVYVAPYVPYLQPYLNPENADAVVEIKLSQE